MFISKPSNSQFVLAVVASVSFLLSLSVYAQVRCEEAFDSSPPTIKTSLAMAQKAWAPSNFTKPQLFDPKHFRLIVHAGPHVINGSNDRDVLEMFLERSTNHDFAEHFFSASIVSEKQTATFNRAGVVLEVPEQKIVAATSDDMRSCLGDCTPEEKVSPLIDDFFKREGLRNPQEILDSAAHGTRFYAFGLDWTEVLINGSAVSPSLIRISGLFSHIDSFGEIMLNASQEKILKTAAQKMHLPLLLLPPPEGTFVLKVRMTKKSRKANLYGNWGPQGIEFLQTRDEVEGLFGRAQAAGKDVTLVDEENGPPPIDAPLGFLQGAWPTRVFDKIKVDNITTYHERKIVLDPAELPKELSPIEFVFNP